MHTEPAKQFDVAIAGGGPAGSSAAIKLALAGARVLLVEQKKFPRPKLCGEFISPECIAHFQQLGVATEMLAAGGSTITTTVFYARNGASVHLPSEWFKPGTAALGLSRSEMDQRLLERAKAIGVSVWEDAHATSLLRTGRRVAGIVVKAGEEFHECSAALTIDATGRNRTLARECNRDATDGKRPELVAFKTHFENAHVQDGACEIYFYKHGYGGLSAVQSGLSNLCFIVASRDVRRYSSDPETVMREVVMKNKRAAQTLSDARAHTPWLSVSLRGFGRYALAPGPGLLTIGDAASFIDPFTGSGILMALESGKLAADIIQPHLTRLPESVFDLSREYELAYSRTFHSRLRTAGLLRRAAFVPGVASAAIRLSGVSSHFRRQLARATHQSSVPSVDVSSIR
jgi:flavin-dependent dehydrogenase